MTVDQAKAALEKARQELRSILNNARHAPTKMVRLPAAMGGYFEERRSTVDPQQIRDADAAVCEAEKDLRAAHLVRHNRLADKLAPKVTAVDEHIAGLQQELNAANEERAALVSEFARQCGCRRDCAHRLEAGSPLKGRQLANSGS
jgi:hypothetical protein